jgi:DNA-binding NarL/FixJ family response regulator
MGFSVVAWHRHRLVREGLVASLLRQPFVVASEPAESMDDLRGSVLRHGALTCVVDLDGLLDTEWAHLAALSAADSVRVVGLTDALDAAQAHRAYEAGVSGIVDTASGLAGLLAELSPSGWRSTSFRRREDPLSIDQLEREVLRLIARGLTARAVASELGITFAKVDAAKRSLFAKLGVQQQSHAVAIAIRSGLLQER